MSSKVFCPLKTKYYNLFKEGRKKWDFSYKLSVGIGFAQSKAYIMRRLVL